MSGSYMGFSGSIKVDMTKFKESMSENTKFGENKVVFRSGGDDLPEPIGVKLVPIGEAFNDNFFASVKEQSNSQCFRDIVRKRGNMIKALHAYPKMKRAVEPKGTNNISIFNQLLLCQNLFLLEEKLNPHKLSVYITRYIILQIKPRPNQSNMHAT